MWRRRWSPNEPIRASRSINSMKWSIRWMPRQRMDVVFSIYPGLGRIENFRHRIEESMCIYRIRHRHQVIIIMNEADRQLATSRICQQSAAIQSMISIWYSGNRRGCVAHVTLFVISQRGQVPRYIGNVCTLVRSLVSVPVSCTFTRDLWQVSAISAFHPNGTTRGDAPPETIENTWRKIRWFLRGLQVHQREATAWCCSEVSQNK